jgi:hypothetical protein
VSSMCLFASCGERMPVDFGLEEMGSMRCCTMVVACRTPEQQGREDDEGEGQRLAVDAKSDLY